jgi:hypothetical protein
MTPLGVKTYGKSEFDIFEAKKRFPDSGKACVLKRKVEKSHFCDFSLQYKAFPESGKRFFALKISNSDFPYVFTPRGVISRKKIFEKILVHQMCSSSLIFKDYAR